MENTAGLPDISPPSVPPAAEPDDLSKGELARAAAEFSALTVTGRQEYLHQQLVQQLQQERNQLRVDLTSLTIEASRLRKVEVEHAAINSSHKLSRLVEAIAAISVAVGSALIGINCTATTSPAVLCYGVGWGLIIVAGAVLLVKSIFNL